MGRLSIETYQYLFNFGGLGMKQLVAMVRDNIITEDEFKTITSYNYKGYLMSKEKKTSGSDE